MTVGTFEYTFKPRRTETACKSVTERSTQTSSQTHHAHRTLDSLLRLNLRRGRSTRRDRKQHAHLERILHVLRTPVLIALHPYVVRIRGVKYCAGCRAEIAHNSRRGEADAGRDAATLWSVALGVFRVGETKLTKVEQETGKEHGDEAGGAVEHPSSPRQRQHTFGLSMTILLPRRHSKPTQMRCAMSGKLS